MTPLGQAMMLLRSGLLAALVAIVGTACDRLQLPEDSSRPPVVVERERSTAPGTAPVEVPVPVRVSRGLPATQSVALVLPLSGRQQAAAEAIRDGFIAAWMADAANPQRPRLTILDEEQPGPLAAYQAAVEAGAGLVVGPLLKRSLAAVAQADGDIPLLALNQLDDLPLPAGSFQFALAPEDEADALVERALALGQRRALILVPDTRWGQRMHSALAAALEAGGGTIVDQLFYDPGAQDHTAQLQRLLRANTSRSAGPAANPDAPAGFSTRRRNDVDCILLAANAAAGRLIRPQLRFLYAGDLPIYATSAIHQPGTRGDSDLDGIMFSDAPAVIGTDHRASLMRASLRRYWPSFAMGELRFYAMGHDAYALLHELGGQQPPAALAYQGLSGELRVDGERRIRRRMSWAVYQDGRILPLGEAAPEEPLMNDGDGLPPP